jgi:hypothetical protein
MIESVTFFVRCFGCSSYEIFMGLHLGELFYFFTSITEGPHVELAHGAVSLFLGSFGDGPFGVFWLRKNFGSLPPWSMGPFNRVGHPSVLNFLYKYPPRSKSYRVLSC